MIRSYSYCQCPKCKKKGAFLIKQSHDKMVEGNIWGKCKYCKSVFYEKEWFKIEGADLKDFTHKKEVQK